MGFAIRGMGKRVILREITMLEIALRWIILLFPIFLSAFGPEETLARMTLDEKIGQLFVAPACPLRQEDHWADWLKILNDCHVGNVIVKQSDPATQVQFLNRLQAESKLPLSFYCPADRVFHFRDLSRHFAPLQQIFLR